MIQVNGITLCTYDAAKEVLKLAASKQPITIKKGNKMQYVRYSAQDTSDFIDWLNEGQGPIHLVRVERTTELQESVHIKKPYLKSYLAKHSQLFSIFTYDFSNDCWVILN